MEDTYEFNPGLWRIRIYQYLYGQRAVARATGDNLRYDAVHDAMSVVELKMISQESAIIGNQYHHLCFSTSTTNR